MLAYLKNILKQIKKRLSAAINGVMESICFSESRVFNTNHKYITVLICVLGLLLFVSLVIKLHLIALIVSLLFFLTVIYLIIYNQINLEKTIKSFAAFATIGAITALYIKGFIFVYNGIPKPFFIENLSLFAQYRYLAFTIGAIVIIGLFRGSFFSVNLKKLLDIISYPYINEEVRHILYTWNNSFIGDSCIKVVDILFNSKKARLLYNAINISIYFFKLSITIIFINFCFFHGDLRIIFYLIPLSFFIWVFNFLKYYFKWFLEINADYVRSLLYVTIKDNNVLTTQNLVTTSRENLVFRFAPYALQEGFTSDVSLQSLSDSWVKLGVVNTSIVQYDYILKQISLITFIFNIFCWSFLSFYFVFYSDTFLMGGEGFFASLLRRSTFSKPSYLRSHRDARYVHEKHMNDLKSATKGSYSPGHPVYGEAKNPGEYHVEGSFTHGKGNSENPAKPLLSSSIDDNARNQSPQSHIPLKALVTVDSGWFTDPIPGSSPKLETPEVKKALDSIKNSGTNDSE